MTERNMPELLSPAGNMECLYAAVNGGCDAVYAAADRFGARAYAGNFTSDELEHAIEYMHLFDKKLYLTLNTLIKPDEMNEIFDFVKPFYEAGLDGVIVQDLGVVRFLKEQFPLVEIHASTQMSIFSVYGVRLLQDMGIKRVVPSRELSLGEIRSIHEATGVELECFIHGAMCYSYSGMCLMSSFLGGRSGNRGRCAGPCRQPYKANSKNSDIGLKASYHPDGADGQYLLSMKDLCTIDILDELIDAGISSFKIEGRMKSPEYVYYVTSIYRRAIDRIVNSNGDIPYKADEDDRQRLVELYSRGGISEGYYHRHNGLSMVTVEKGAYKREDTEKLKIGKKRIPIKANIYVHVGKIINVNVTTMDEQMSISCHGDIAEKATSRPTTEDELRKQINKTGESDFYFEEINVDTDGECFVKISLLNGLRRKALHAMGFWLTRVNRRCM